MPDTKMHRNWKLPRRDASLTKIERVARKDHRVCAMASSDPATRYAVVTCR